MESSGSARNEFEWKFEAESSHTLYIVTNQYYHVVTN